MPNYLITIHMRVGNLRQDVRFNPSHDQILVREIVWKKIKESIGFAIVEKFYVEPTARKESKFGEIKTLTED